MKVFKFGGASVKDAEGVRNVLRVLRHEGFQNTLIVISAMGKMTNAFEEIVNSYCNNSKDLEDNIEFVRQYHLNIINELFNSKNHSIFMQFEQLFGQLSGFLIQNKNTDYNYIYDQIVGFGELLSTKIVSSFLNDRGLDTKWIDVRNYIKTDSCFRDANVDWEFTSLKISELCTSHLYITQGFLGSDLKGNTTTLGREGSDYTAAIFAYCLNADNLTIWKDVEGVLNADPRYFEDTQLLKQISYNEAIEMAFYGASVIHPKTIKPLENRDIELFVRSFYNLEERGTVVGKGNHISPEVPCFILKKNQILISISALDFSFMVENNLSDIFKILHNYKLKVNLIQNSALSFSVCVEDVFNNISQFKEELKLKYNATYMGNVSLYTIRHSTESAVVEIERRGKVLLKQSTKRAVQFIML